MTSLVDPIGSYRPRAPYNGPHVGVSASTHRNLGLGRHVAQSGASELAGVGRFQVGLEGGNRSHEVEPEKEASNYMFP